jgi:hypothetical protein
MRSLMVTFIASREKRDREGSISDREMLRPEVDRGGAEGIKGARRCMVACKETCHMQYSAIEQAM